MPHYVGLWLEIANNLPTDMLTTYLDVINKFHECVDDASRLSTQQEVALAQLVTDDIIDRCNFGFTVNQFNGTLTSGEVDLPDDFIQFARTYSNEYGGEDRLGVFVNGQFFNVSPMVAGQIPMARKAYVNWAEDKLVVPNTSGTVMFYYNAQPTVVDISNYATLNPPFPKRYNDVIAYGMAARFYPIDGTEQGASQINIYTQMYEDKILQLKRREIQNTISQAN